MRRAVLMPVGKNHPVAVKKKCAVHQDCRQHKKKCLWVCRATDNMKARLLPEALFAGAMKQGNFMVSMVSRRRSAVAKPCLP